MKAVKIILMVGIPASGKSTWALKQLENNSKMVRVSRDDYRFMMRNEPMMKQKGEKLITKLVNNHIETFAAQGFDVLVDQTNCNLTYLEPFVEWCRKHGDVHFKLFDTDFDTCIERDAARGRTVGVAVMRRMQAGLDAIKDSNFDFSVRKKLPRFVSAHKVNNPESLPEAFIFDVDGTLAHNMGKRSFFDWGKVDLDEPDEFVIQMANDLNNAGYEIIVVTGRDGISQDLTSEWLHRNSVPHHALYCRAAGDNRSDDIIKKEIYETYIKPNYYVRGVFDDRDQVVSFWRSVGIKTYQVEYGNF